MSRKCYCLFSIIAICLVLLGQQSGTWAEEEHVGELPFVFSQEGTEIKTSACLRLREKVYSIPWNSFSKEARSEPETLLTGTIAAMQNKDSASFRKMSHPMFGT